MMQNNTIVTFLGLGLETSPLCMRDVLQNTAVSEESKRGTEMKLKLEYGNEDALRYS